MPGLAPAMDGALPMRTTLRDALWVLAACAAVGLAVNTLRRDGIALIRTTPYEILVPCPETAGETEAVPADSPLILKARTLLVDARSTAEFDRWHPQGAMNVPYDYLEPTGTGDLKRMAASGAARVVVFGDGLEPDSGEQLAKEISGRGIKNVGFVPGGAAALRGVPEKGSP